MIQLWEKGIQHIEVIILKIQHDPFSCFMRVVLWFGFRDRIWMSFYHLSRWFFLLYKWPNGHECFHSVSFMFLSNIGWQSNRPSSKLCSVQWDVHPKSAAASNKYMTAITHITRNKRWCDNVVIFNWIPLGFPFGFFLRVPPSSVHARILLDIELDPPLRNVSRQGWMANSHIAIIAKSHEFPVDFWKNLAVIPIATVDGDLVTDRWTDVASHDASRASRGSDWTAQISVNLEVEPLWIWKLRW